MRRIAFALIEHAARILPAARAPWAEAMRHEIHHIEKDRKALTWAIGCVFASYVESVRVLRISNPGSGRVLLASWVGCEALYMLCTTILTLAWQLNDFKHPGLLRTWTAYENYRQYIPLMEAIPWWLHALWVATAVLLLATAMQILRKRRAAYSVFASAWLLGSVSDLIAQSLPAYRAARSFQSPMPVHEYVTSIVTALVPVLTALALRARSRPSDITATFHRP